MMSQDMLNASDTTAMEGFNAENNYDFYSDQFENMSNNQSYDDSSSYWCEAGEQEFTIKMFQTCVFCVIFLLGVVGNCLVIATFALYRRLRLRSMTDVFLFHLALADLLLLLTLPLQAIDTHLDWIFSLGFCKFMRACYAINTYSGLMLLACISVDRYLVVARAQEMFRLRGLILRVGKIAGLGVWMAAVLLSLPEILYSGLSDGPGDDGVIHYYCGMKMSGKWKMVPNGAIIVIFCLSFIIMVTCYSLIAQVLCGGNNPRRGKQGHRQRTLKLMVALVLVFLVFQLPYTVVLSLKMAGEFCDLLVEYITCTLAYTRCCLNPILYALVGVRFRKDVWRLIQDSGCPCDQHMEPLSISSNSITPSSPAVTVLSVCPQTSPERNHSSNEKALIPTKF